MRRILSSLLIPLLLFSQSFCAAHSHAGTSVVEPEGHSARAHVHLNAGQHHHDLHGHEEHEGSGSHDESPTVPSEQGPVDHDSDAVYVTDTQLLDDAKSAKVANAELAVDCVIYDDSATIAGLRLVIGRGSPPPLLGLKCPLYLRTLCIRC